MAFDAGADVNEAAGGKFKNPDVGAHSARLASVIHCGKYQERFKDELKDPCNEAIAIFELKDDKDFEEDGTTPLYLAKPFPLKEGSKAFMTKLIKALDPEGKASGFDDLIGAVCQIDAVGSKAVDEKGAPKYVNFGGISALPAQFAKFVPEMVGGVGHVRYEDMTKEALMELSSFHVQDYIIGDGSNKNAGVSLSYVGSKAEAIISEIREKNPDFAKRKPKESDGKQEEQKPDTPTLAPAENTLDENEEY